MDAEQGLYSTTPAAVAALIALVLGGLAFWAVHRRIGRDAVTPAIDTGGRVHPVGDSGAGVPRARRVRPRWAPWFDEQVDPWTSRPLIDLTPLRRLRFELPRSRPTPFTPVDALARQPVATLRLRRTLLDAVALPKAATGTAVTDCPSRRRN